MKVSRVRVSGLARLGSAWGGDYMVAGSGWAARYPRVMRYLTRSFAIGALRRGRGIEQFLGGAEVGGVAGIRWVGGESLGELLLQSLPPYCAGS